MSKLINLDEMASPERKIRFKGEVHEVVEFTLEHFINFQRSYKEMAAAQESGDFGAMIAVARKMIQESIPTLTDDLVRKFNQAQLTAVVQLISDVYPESPSGNGESETQGQSTDK